MTEKKNRSMIQRRLIPTYVFLIIVSFISVFPAAHAALPHHRQHAPPPNTSFDVAQGRLLPGTYLATNFANLTAGRDLWGTMWNSFIYAFVQTILALLICSLAGFGFELYHDKKKDIVFTILLLAMMIPGVATMIPLFRMVSKMGLLNSVWGFILPAISTPFLIMMFRNNSRNFPVDVMEAARIDGLREIQIFYRRKMPMMTSTNAPSAVVTFINAWNSYLWPKVIMTDTNAQTMPMLIANLASGYTTDYGVLMLGVLFCSVPTMVIFFILQKQFAEGLTGAVK